ncbi:MAG TPA: LuxR C-terminal-related transcriptional regulator [Ornithinibacter sp.]|nr:LuxR C-terminal-related transcriptional regulator [Ornithinibacter sp.]
MTRPLVATKLYVPRLRRGLVARPRLVDRLGGDGRLTLVSAPAGFGKTTLLASWLGPTTDDRRVAWLSLDASDDDPVSFWTGVVTALDGAVPGLGAVPLDLLRAAPTSTDPVLTALLNELAAVPDEVWLVLDDYHLVRDQEVGRGMTFLVEHLPPHVHVVLSTRADPDLPLARWRVRGELVEIRAVDLRFSAGEAAAYLDEATGVRLTAEQVQALEGRTEGWIAALQLAAISLRGRDDVAAFIAGFAGDDRYVFDYLVEEVLAHQPQPVRDFLLRSAVLDRFTGPLCDAVLARDDSGAMLQTLERTNLFLVALDDRREWYRYHQLFADVLRARLVGEQPEQVPVLHERASQWYEQHDLADEAVQHALAANDVDRAARLVEQAVPMIRRQRREAVVAGWLAALPDDTVRRSPVLSVFAAALRMVAGDLAAVEPRLDDAEAALAAAEADGIRPWPDTEELRTLPSTIAMYRASLAQARGDVEATAEHARQALDLAGPDDHLARGGAAGFLGLTAWARGDVTQALATFGQAVDSLRAAGNLVDALSGTVVLADLWRASGRPVTARERCTRALQEAERHGEPVARATAELHVALAELDVEADDLDAARRHLQAAERLVSRAPVNETHFRYFVAGALLAAATGDLTGAVDLLDRAEQLYRPGFFPDVRPIPAMRARIRVREGELTAAAAWARDRGVALTDAAEHLREYDHLTLVRLVLAEYRAHPVGGGPNEVLGLLDRLREAASTWGREGSLVEVDLVRALAHDAAGRRQQALTTLADGLTVAPEPEGYARLLLDEGEPALALLEGLDPATPAGQQARRVLATGTPDRSRSADPRPGTPPSADPLSEREQQVLRLLDSELSGPEIARALFISPNTLRTHTKHVFTKLGVSSRREAVARARERGLLSPADG